MPNRCTYKTLKVQGTVSYETQYHSILPDLLAPRMSEAILIKFY